MTSITEERVRDCLLEFVESCGVKRLALSADTDLLTDLGMSSDQGLEFVLDLCEVLEHHLPNDFNPFVHPSGKRGRKFGELVSAVEAMMCKEGAQ